MAILSGLTTPYPNRATLKLAEALRATLVKYCHDDPAVSTQRIVDRVAESELRGLLSEALPPTTPTDGASTKDLDTILTARFRDLGRLGESVAAAGVTLEEYALLRTSYLESPILQRRVVGFCALACLCAERRGSLQ